MISASGTKPRMAPVHVGFPWLATGTLVTLSSRGEASADVTFAATGTQQYLWGSSHGTSECGLTTTVPSCVALEAVSSVESTAFGRCTPCGRHCTSHPHIDLIAPSAVIYSAQHTVVEWSGWYTTIVPCCTAAPSRSEVIATCGSCGTLSDVTTSETGLASASGAGPVGSSNTMAQLPH